MFAFNWPIIILTTIILYVLTIITLPFNAVLATIMLFSLISFWSRLPGVCIYEPVSIIYLMDFVDIFSIIIAIYVGPVQGAVFSLIWNLYPRLSGIYKTWPALIKDAGIQALITLLSPVLYAVTGSIVTVVVIYSVLRLVLFWFVNIFVPTRGFIEQTVRLMISGVALMVINVFYARLFGEFFSSLLQKGARFSWVLFIVASIIILVFAVIVFGFSPKKTGRHIGTGIARIVKHQRKKKKPQTKNADAEDMRLARESAKQNKF